MYKFRSLEWHPYLFEELNGVYAEPLNLKWHYSIIKHAENKVEFAILDSHYEYAPGFPKICKSVTAAQAMADKHYASLLEHHLALHD
jgi:hypothetical protein